MDWNDILGGAASSGRGTTSQNGRQRGGFTQDPVAAVTRAQQMAALPAGQVSTQQGPRIKSNTMPSPKAAERARREQMGAAQMERQLEMARQQYLASLGNNSTPRLAPDPQQRIAAAAQAVSPQQESPSMPVQQGSVVEPRQRPMSAPVQAPVGQPTQAPRHAPVQLGAEDQWLSRMGINSDRWVDMPITAKVPALRSAGAQRGDLAKIIPHLDAFTTNRTGRAQTRFVPAPAQSVIAHTAVGKPAHFGKPATMTKPAGQISASFSVDPWFLLSLGLIAGGVWWWTTQREKKK